MKALKAIVAILPGPVLIWVGKWIEIFANTQLANPEWQAGAVDLAKALATACVVLTAVLFASAKPRRLKGFGIALFVAFCALCLLCVGFHFYLGQSLPYDSAQRLELAWKITFILAMISLPLCISVGTLAVPATGSKGWYVAITLIVVLAAVAAYLGYRLYSG